MMDFEDCLQVSAEVFVRCHNLYAEKVDEPKWFMALYKRALSNEFHTLSSQCTEKRTAEFDYAEASVFSRSNVEHEEASFLVALQEASSELKDVFRVVANAPSEFLKVLLQEADDEAWSRRLCRLARTAKVNSSVVAELRALVVDNKKNNTQNV